jgi:hypothetical protein
MELSHSERGIHQLLFMTCQNAGKGVLTAEGTALKGRGIVVNKPNFIFSADSVSDLMEKGCINDQHRKMPGKYVSLPYQIKVSETFSK